MSSGKQTSWEHTSLIGNFCLNSGKLIHSVDIPYKQEYVADENFQSSGSLFDEIIVDLTHRTFEMDSWPTKSNFPQIPVSKWHEIIGEQTIADAILDRSVHDAHRIEMKGESLRKKNNQKIKKK